MEAKLLLLHALSPLHPGTGRGIGMIDLPIAREKATGIPFLPGSSMKGVLRECCEDDNTRTRVFGPDTNSAEDFAGAINVTDMRLLLLPVRSMRGTFAWVTSPLLLRRFLRDARAAGEPKLPQDVPEPENDEHCLIASGNRTLAQADGARVILEDLSLTAAGSPTVLTWAQWLGARLFPDSEEDHQQWSAALEARFCVVSDDVMSFLLEIGTEVTARIALESETKTVRDGALWYEEALPAETILTGLVIAQEIKKSNASVKEVFETVACGIEKPLQVGGSATVGRGFCKVYLSNVSKPAAEEG